jgi:hypothetical protein
VRNQNLKGERQQVKETPQVKASQGNAKTERQRQSQSGDGKSQKLKARRTKACNLQSKDSKEASRQKGERQQVKETPKVKDRRASEGNAKTERQR